MYSIYCNGTLIFSPAMQQQSYALTDIVLKEEDGKIATLELRVPPVNVGYSLFQLITSRVVLYNDATPIFAGRPISIRKDFLGNKRVVCESALAYLRDTIIEQVNYPGSDLYDGMSLSSALTTIINDSNDLLDANRQFSLGVAPVTYPSAYFRDVTAGSTPLDVLQTMTSYENSLHYYLDPSVRWTGSGGSVSNILDIRYTTDRDYGTQTIEFGKNLLDLDDYIDASSLFTVLTLFDVDNEVYYPYQESAMVSAYGWIGKYYKVSGLSKWTDPAAGRAYEAEKYYTANARAVQTIKLSALDMSLAGLAADRFEVGKYYRVISAPHGLNTYYKCVRAVRRLLDPSKDVYEFGVTQKPLTRLLTS